MPYVLRDANGSVQAVSKEAMAGDGWEEVGVDNREYLDYLSDALSKNDKFRESDIQLARVLEDLISLLIDRDYIRFTDFPEKAQKRLIDRAGMRTRKSELDLIGEEENDF